MATWTKQSKPSDSTWTNESVHSATWTKDYPYENGPQITYNEAGATYDDVRYTYGGKLITTWTNEAQS